MSGVENFEFHEKRAEGASLSKIKNELRAIKTAARARLDKHVSDTMITSLLSPEGFKINQGDTLAGISAITAVGNRLEFYPGADHIDIGDIITIRDRKLMRNDTVVGKVLEGYEASTSEAVASLMQDVERESNKRETSTVSRRNRSERSRQNAEVNEMHDGDLLANYISERGYPIWKSGAFCGQNVGNMLSLFGSPQLPSWGRHGYRWTSFLDGNPGFTKVRINSPSEAEAGGICVYDRGYGSTRERQTYGHVEVALGNGEFYYGHKKNHPGGSIDASRNPDNSGFTGYAYYPVTSKFDDMMMVA